MTLTVLSHRLRAAPEKAFISGTFSLPSSKAGSSSQRKLLGKEMQVLAFESCSSMYLGIDSKEVLIVKPIVSATMRLYLSIVNPWKLRTVFKVSGRYHSPLFELWVLQPVWETLPANTNAFQDSIASQLVHDQVGIHDTCQEGGYQLGSHYPMGGMPLLATQEGWTEHPRHHLQSLPPLPQGPQSPTIQPRPKGSPECNFWLGGHQSPVQAARTQFLDDTLLGILSCPVLPQSSVVIESGLNLEQTLTS